MAGPGAGVGAGAVAAIVFGPGRWDGWYATWAGQYAEWAPGNLGQLTWPFRCMLDRDDITGRLGEIGCPALIVHGSQDAAIAPAEAEGCAAGLPGPGHLRLDRRGSPAVNLAHPGVVNAEILSFLGTLAD